MSDETFGKVTSADTKWLQHQTHLGWFGYKHLLRRPIPTNLSTDEKHLIFNELWK